MGNLTWMEGRIIASVEGLDEGSYEVIFRFIDGGTTRFYHSQDCCETVDLADYDAPDPEDLEGHFIISAEETEGDGERPEYAESYTWTFYNIHTSGGSIWMRWLGESNGYYSESVDIDTLNRDYIVKVDGADAVLLRPNSGGQQEIARRPFNPVEVRELAKWAKMVLEVTKH